MRLNLVGTRFGRLVVMREGQRIHKKIRRWYCVCDCGGTTTAQQGNLRNGHTTSCGCWQDECRGANSVTHGQERNHTPTKTLKAWREMRARCKPDNAARKWYFDKGITVCVRWFSFANFLADMGEAPKGYSIDRIDGTKGYCPENCRWATKREQANNRSSNRMVTYMGTTQSLAEWVRVLGLKYGAVSWRINRGWPLDSVFSTARRAQP